MNRLIIAALLMFPAVVSAQEWDPRHDTLTAAVKTDSRRVAEAIGRVSTDLDGVRRVISPLGEGDPIRCAQGLPGVSIGADGTTARTASTEVQRAGSIRFMMLSR